MFCLQKNDFKIASDSEIKQVLDKIPSGLYKMATFLAVRYKDDIYMIKDRLSYKTQEINHILISKRKYESMSISEKESLAGQYILFDITDSYFKFEDEKGDKIMNKSEIKKTIEQLKDERLIAEKQINQLQERTRILEALIKEAQFIADKKTEYEISKEDTRHWTIGYDLSVQETTAVSIIESRFKKGIGFSDEKLAVQTSKELELYTSLKKFSIENGWNEKVWEDFNIEKFYIGKLTTTNTLDVGHVSILKAQNVVYFISEKVAREALFKFGSLLKEVV